MTAQTIRGHFTRFWWIPLLTGLLSIAIGVWIFIQPAESMISVAYFFTGCLLAAGLLNIGYAFMGGNTAFNWGWSLALGMLELIAGGWFLTLSPGFLVTAFMYGAAIWLLFISVNAICESSMIAVSAGGGRGWHLWSIMLMIAVIVLAFMFLRNLPALAAAEWLFLACCFVGYGCYRIMLAFRMRKLNKVFRPLD